jgi:hypothetical protein
VWSEEHFAAEPQPVQATQRSTGSAEQEQGARWVTINGRHVLMQASQTGPAQQTTGDRIAKTAEKYEGSKAWSFTGRKDDFGPNTNKCNKFVYDVTEEAGAPALVIGSDGEPRPPLAAERADPRTSIPGWRALGTTEMPQPGDVAAYKIPRHADYTGHSGIVTSVDPSGFVHGTAAHQYVVGPDEKFNSARGRPVTYRRYTGG